MKQITQQKYETNDSTKVLNKWRKQCMKQMTQQKYETNDAKRI